MIKYRLIHNRKKKLKKDGTALIQIEMSIARDRKYISSEISIAPKFWSQKDQLIKESHPRSTELNFRIKNILMKVDSILKDAALKNIDIGLEDVIANLSIEQDVKLIDFMTEEIEKDERIKLKTKKDLLNTRNKIMDFKPSIKLQEVDFRFVSDLDNYLRRRKYAINTIAKTHKNIKRFLNLAINYGLVQSQDYAYRNFKIQHESTQREALSISEVHDIENLSYERHSVIHLVKDMFLFSCYTGLRISDVVRFENDWLRKTERGWFAEFITFKAGKRAYLPLFSLFKTNQKYSQPEIIVEHYFSNHNNRLFPEISEQKINRHLKAIAKDAGIEKKLTFHMGRHTFGTIMASRIPIGTLQELMQHSDIKTTMVYVNMTKQILEDDLGKVNWIE